MFRTAVALASNFAFWAATRLFSGAMRPMLGVPDGVEMTEAQKADVQKVMASLLPVRERTQGALFDMYVSNLEIKEGLALERIDAPVLVIAARDDPLALYRNSAAMAERLSDGRLLTIESGGHMMLGHEELVRRMIAEFLAEIADRE